MTNFCSLTLVLSALMTVHALPKAGWGSGWGSGTEDCAATSNWPGFEGLKHAFVLYVLSEDEDGGVRRLG